VIEVKFFPLINMLVSSNTSDATQVSNVCSEAKSDTHAK